jgi:phosphatidylglycerophosphate synthase
MPSGKSFPESAAEHADRRAGRKIENRFIPKFLQLNKYVNRPAASIIVRAVYRTRVTPNQLTVASFLVGLAGAYCFFRGKTGWILPGAILTQLSSIVDCADGMLARARGQSSEFGAVLDLLCDRVNEYFLIVGYAYGFYRLTGRHSVFVLGLVTCGLYFLHTTIYYLMKASRGDRSLGDTAESRSWVLFLAAAFAVARRFDLGIYTLFAASLSINVMLVARFLRTRRG